MSPSRQVLVLTGMRATVTEICTAFLSVLDKEEEAFFCLKALQRLSNDACPPSQIIQRYALCLSLFRSLLPQLFARLQSMRVDTAPWLLSWLQFLLSVELPMPSLLRLWDYYFSDDECVHTHMFVCLGVLQVLVISPPQPPGHNVDVFGAGYAGQAAGPE